MNLRFVEAFVWVARLQSITRGAEKLHLTQSAVSNRVAMLEQELGTALLDRRERGFALTPAGARFVQHAERLLALQREIRTEFGSPEQQPLSLRIGGIETALHTWLIPMIERVKQSNAQLELELTIETTPALVELLRRGSRPSICTPGTRRPTRPRGYTGPPAMPFDPGLPYASRSTATTWQASPAPCPRR